MSSYQEKMLCFLAGCVLTFFVMFILVLIFVPRKETSNNPYVFNNPPAPPVVDTFYPDDLVWHKYLKRAGVVTRVHRGDNQVRVIPVMVKNGEIIAIKQSNELVQYWTSALIFKTSKENFVLLNKLKKENK